MRSDLTAVIDDIRAFHGRPMSVHDIVESLDAREFWDENWIEKVLARGKAKMVQDSLRREGPDGLPMWARTGDGETGSETWEQIGFLDEAGWKFNIDDRAKRVEADWEKLMRFVDAFENRFGYRYMPDALRRLCELHYGDETSEDAWR